MAALIVTGVTITPCEPIATIMEDIIIIIIEDVGSIMVVIMKVTPGIIEK
jgi:hypothetical protein